MSTWTFKEIAPNDPDWGACEIWDGDSPVATMVFGTERAKLIAAAPDLLEACEAAKKYLEPDLVEPGRTVFWNLVAAIAKAKGEAP